LQGRLTVQRQDCLRLLGGSLGIAHALGLYRGFVDGDCFVVHLDGNLLQHGIKKFPRGVRERRLRRPLTLEGDQGSDDVRGSEVRRKGQAGGSGGEVREPSEYALVGVYFFKPMSSML